jgi:hypothetical protein
MDVKKEDNALFLDHSRKTQHCFFSECFTVSKSFGVPS